jgi:methyl-accepting chemotaxis protein
MIRRVLGTVLILIGALGIALSVLGVLNVWRVTETVTVAAEDTLDLLSDTLDNVKRSLDVTSTTLDDAAVALDGLHTTSIDVGQTLSSTQTTLDGTVGLVEDNLPESIESTLIALEAVEETAGVIDQMLRGLSQFGVGDYDPDVPLDRAIAEAGEGLGPVPDSLREMGDGLRQTSASLDEVQDGIMLMGDHILDIRGNVSSADTVIGDYVELVQELQERLDALRQVLGQPIRTAAWGVTLLLVWIGLSQLALIQWGISLWRRPEAK